MAIYKCEVCGYEYDEEKEGIAFAELPSDWLCPVCESTKNYYIPSTDDTEADTKIDTAEFRYEDYVRTGDPIEKYMDDIHSIADNGGTIIEPMRTRVSTVAWDEILIKGAQMAKLPLDDHAPVNAATVIGPGAKMPLVIESPIFVTHMSFGALSKEAKIALAKGSAAAKTAMCSGEGGILPESIEASYKYIFEYVPNRYSVTDEYLQRSDAIEIKLGQSAKPGMGGHLPGDKVTSEIAAIRGFPEGSDIISPSHHPDIRNPEELKETVASLRKRSGGRPVGVKIAGGNIEADLKAVLHSNPDFVTIDGRAGATGAAPKFVKAATSMPSIFALYRARKFLDENKAGDISLIITGGFRISPDFAKAIAMGADAVALGTSALMAIGCQQYRMCHTGKCPMGITSQNPDLRARLDIEKAAKGLENFLNVSKAELKTFARLTGGDDVHAMSSSDLCTTNSEISGHTDIGHV
jgi:methylamine---glutamate N-methyltransferase subunit C